jgi:hypothetical protein
LTFFRAILLCISWINTLKKLDIVKMRGVTVKITFNFFVRDIFTSDKFQTNERKSPTKYCE